MLDKYFSENYLEARRRFREAAEKLGANLHSYPLGLIGEGDLSIDVAIVGEDDAPALVLSSGVHGVEGFFGSAVQLAFMEQTAGKPLSKSLKLVLIHAVNPFGFAHLRRFNEDNIDLNRHFLSANQNYSGSPAGYAPLNAFLNPQSPPSAFEPFFLKALLRIWKNGLQALKESIAVGQYEFPRGLFYGGAQSSASKRLIEKNCATWIGNSTRVVHIDFHTGLGPFAEYKLLLGEKSESETAGWFADHFGKENVEAMDAGATAYDARGMFGQWMAERFADRDYRFMAAEFGTYGPIKVLGALRAEQRAHFYCDNQDPRFERAKKAVLEAFCPKAPKWRNQVVGESLNIIGRAVYAL